MEEKKNVFKDIKEKTAGMPFRDKVDYMWEYYRIHFLVIVFGVIFVISLTASIITSKLSDPVLNCGVLNEIDIYCGDKLDAAIQETFPESTGFRKPMIIGVASPANEDSVMYSTTQLIALLNTHDLDCLLCDQESLDLLRNSDLSMEVTEMPDCQLTQLAKALNIPKLYYVVFTDFGHPEEARKFLEVCKTLEIATVSSGQ